MLQAQEFRRLMSLFPTGVTVVSTFGEEGPAGMTVNALASLSLDPILVMVGFDLASRTFRAVQQSGRFGVSFLSQDQQEVSGRFATKLPEAEKFGVVAHHLRLGVPILDRATAWLVCDVERLHPGGDHVIGVGRVVSMGRNGADPDPLVFYRGGYATLNGNGSAASGRTGDRG
ncbi:MAG TPA: flavin reductase family protein [Actinomycetes bacterium]|nr:flavin reductase family protein [Actinomycetes bacterium]